LQFRRIIIFVSFGSVLKGVCFCGDKFFHFFANKKQKEKKSRTDDPKKQEKDSLDKKE